MMADITHNSVGHRQSSITSSDDGEYGHDSVEVAHPEGDVRILGYMCASTQSLHLLHTVLAHVQ